jgi:hypothetical protein
MKLSELLVIGQQQYQQRDGNSINASKFKDRAYQFIQDFGEGAAVFVADRLVWFGDAGAARNEARSIVGHGYVSRDKVSIRRIVPDTTYPGGRFRK